MAVPILKEPPITTREAIIPYAMAGVNMIAPILFAQDILSQQPMVFQATVAMIILGLPVSIYFRQRQYNRIIMNLIIMLPLLALTWSLTHSHRGLQIDWNNLWSSMLTHDSWEVMAGLLLVFSLLAAGRAFLLVSSTDLLQTPLPSFSIFLLSAIIDQATSSRSPLERSPFALFCLLMLCFSSLYLFSQEQSQQWFSIHTPLRFQRRLILWTLAFSLIMLPLVAAIGWSLQPLNMIALARRAQNPRSLHLRLPFVSSGQFALSFGDNIDMQGGNWPRGKQPMMEVKVTGKAQNLLWRAGTYAYYNGTTQQWQPDTMSQENVVTSPRDTANNSTPGYKTDLSTSGSLTFTTDPLRMYSDPGLAEAIREKLINPYHSQDNCLVFQNFTLQADVIGTREPIYGLYQIFHVTASRESRGLNCATTDTDGSVSFFQPDRAFNTYDVVSIIKPLPTMMPQLKVDPVLPDRDKYLQMPYGNPNIPGEKDNSYYQHVRHKAMEILAESKLTLKGSSKFEIIHQFELYLGKHYRYTLTPAPPKGGGDTILNFLLNQPQGYCNYFSSAMVMLCRSVGIPARFAVGFASGDIVEDKSTAYQTVYQVNSSDAHSWVEVYLPRYGWYTVDPTAGSKPVPTLWEDAWDNVTNFVNSAKTKVNALITAYQTNPHFRGYLLLAAASLLVLLAGFIYWRRERPPAFPRRTLSDEQAKNTVLASYWRMHRWLLLWGVTKPHGLTASEFDELFRSINPPMGALVSQLTTLYLRASYGSSTILDADARKSIELLQQLWELASTERKNLHAQHVE